MPSYDTECSSCGYRDEIIESMDGEKVRECPKCGEHTYYRCIGSGCGVIMDVVRDSMGTPVWHPGKPYFDKSLQRTFYDKHEKAKYLKEHGLVMDGSNNRSSTKDSESLIEGVDK